MYNFIALDLDIKDIYLLLKYLLLSLSQNGAAEIYFNLRDLDVLPQSAKDKV